MTSRHPALLSLLLCTGAGCAAGTLDGSSADRVAVHVQLGAGAALSLAGPGDEAAAFVADLRDALAIDPTTPGARALTVTADAAAVDDAADDAVEGPVTVAVVVDAAVDRARIAALAEAHGFEPEATEVASQALIAYRLTGAHFALCPDYDGNGRCDVAFFRPSTAQWWVRNDPASPTVWGGGSDTPVLGDYDGDGRTDRAVFRPATGQWRIARSSLGAYYVTFGSSATQPLPADYDGDGLTDLAVFDPALRQIRALRSRDGSVGVYALPYGGAYRPMAIDVDGDGMSDAGQFFPGTSAWVFLGSRTGGQLGFTQGATWSSGPASQVGYGVLVSTTGANATSVFGGGFFSTRNANGGGGQGFGPIAYAAGVDIPVAAEVGGTDVCDWVVFNPQTGLWHGRDYGVDHAFSFYWGGYGDVPLGARP